MKDKGQGNLKDILGKRKAILDRIREQMPSEASALEALDMALAVMGGDSPERGEYSEIRRGIDAVVAHLKKAGKPLPRRQLVLEVVAGGWKAGDPLAYMKLWDVIRHQLDGAPKPLIVKRKDDTIGLARGASDSEKGN